ncbi:MAG: lipid-A-disaccharide synthase [Lysobacterales bacterium]
MPVPESSSPKHIVMIAGESSGDRLGAALARELKTRYPSVKLSGVTGEAMNEAGVECWYDCQALALMGFAEVVSHLPELLKLRKTLAQKLIENPPDCFIGIDAPDFNLGLAKKLKLAGVPTIHYVSPSIWAWRQGRAGKIGQCVDLILTLFPFEPAIYKKFGVPAKFVGHPSAQAIALKPDRLAARQALGLASDAQVVALLPGSRGGEIKRLGGVIAEAARRMLDMNPTLQFVTPTATTRTRQRFEQCLKDSAVDEHVKVLDGQSFSALCAADVAIIASGTATLEALLCKTPMVVTYRISPITHFIVKLTKMMKVEQFSLPNALAGEALVPELMQAAATAEALAQATEELLAHSPRRQHMLERFAQIHQTLRSDTSAGEQVIQFINKQLAGQ